ncbi:MAG: hypothetical protein ACR2RE_31180, partial [Geminicoccaceae bacterium]
MELELAQDGEIVEAEKAKDDEDDEDSEDDEEEVTEGRLVLGHFSDRRGMAVKHWIGDIFGWFRYPKSVLATEEAVTVVVRRFVKDHAERRDLLTDRSADAIYQLSGEIIQLQGKAYLEAEARAEINVRLTTPDGSEQVYEKSHEVYIVRSSGFFAYSSVKDALETALNKAIAEALEDDDFLEVIESAEEA